MKTVVKFVLAAALLAPYTFAQKPPAPPPQPPPPSGGGNNPGNPNNNNIPSGPLTLGTQPDRMMGDRVSYLTGKVATSDGTALPSNVMVERVCNARVKQQVYATVHGDFNMDLGSTTAQFVDASAESSMPNNRGRTANDTGIPRIELSNCEIRASVSGFRSRVVSLAGMTPTISTLDVGAVVVERTTKIKGMTLSATPYKAPKDALKEYEKGIEAKKDGKLEVAQQHFEDAVKLYPKYTSAWYQLGTVLQKEKQKDEAHAAFVQATITDNKFLPPYLSLAGLEAEAANWKDVLKLTSHVVALEPLKHDGLNGYILDLDSLDYAEVYFYEALANYNLQNLEAAEKSGMKAERLDVRPRFPQLRLLLADIFAQKNQNAAAIKELQMFLEIAPGAKNAEQVRERIEELKKLNEPLASEKREPK